MLVGLPSQVKGGPGPAQMMGPAQVRGFLDRAGRGIPGCAGEVERAGEWGLVPMRASPRR